MKTIFTSNEVNKIILSICRLTSQEAVNCLFLILTGLERAFQAKLLKKSSTN